MYPVDPVTKTFTPALPATGCTSFIDRDSTGGKRPVTARPPDPPFRERPEHAIGREPHLEIPLVEPRPASYIYKQRGRDRTRPALWCDHALPPEIQEAARAGSAEHRDRPPALRGCPPRRGARRRGQRLGRLAPGARPPEAGP